MKKSFKVVTSLALAVVVMFGMMLGVTNRAAAQDGTANVRVIHASPDAPAVDIWVNGSVAIEGLEFGDATDWIPLPAGSYDVAVAPAGAPASDAVLEATLDLEAGVNYNVAAIGFLADIAATVFTTDTADLAEGQARVQVVHLSPDAPTVDVAVAGGPVLVAGLSFPDASGALDVDSGSYDLEVRPAGTEDVALDLPGVALDAGIVYDVLAIGSLADGSLTVLPLTTEAAASEDGVGGVTQVSDTGVGSTVQGGSGMLLLLAAVAAVVLFAGAAVVAPARRRF